MGIDLELPDQKPSVYPFNQVQETESGHVIEIDDTPGGERILINRIGLVLVWNFVLTVVF